MATGKERESHETKAKEGRKRAGQILTKLASLIDMVDPSIKMKKMVGKNKASLVKDLTGLPSTSAHYTTCIEEVCDDLLETADK